MALGLLAPALAVLLGVLVDGEDDPDGAAGGTLATVFVGDSISRGVNPVSFEPDDTYSWVRYAVTDARSPWRLEANVAEPGRTLLEMAERFRDEVLTRDPDAVVIMGGTNDVLQGRPVEPSVAALRSMVTAAQEEGIEVWVVAPPPLDPAYGRDLAPLVDAEAALAAELGVPFVDVRDELSGSYSGWAEGLSADGVHPSAEGARRLAGAILDEVDQ